MTQHTPILLFAALRRTNLSGAKVLILVDPKTGKCFEEEEDALKNEPMNIVLGSFLHLSVEEEINKYARTELPNNWEVNVQKDVAFVQNVKSSLVTENEKQVFRSEFFADSVFQGKLTAGEYTVRIRLLTVPHRVSPSSVAHFEATKPFALWKKMRRPDCIPRMHPLSRSNASSLSSMYLPSVPRRRKSNDNELMSPVMVEPNENLLSISEQTSIVGAATKKRKAMEKKTKKPTMHRKRKIIVPMKKRMEDGKPKTSASENQSN